jgi:uncharacterized protein (TIGR02145 family)
MKTIVTLIMCCCLCISLFAQVPQIMSYQAVIRDVSGNLVTNHAVGMKVSILQGSPTGTIVFQELYNPNPQTNANGLVSIEIGTGIPITGTFSGINWSTGPSYLKTETDPLGGTNYTISGTSQLLSVPYALYAKTADYNALFNRPTILNSQWTTSGSNIHFSNGNVGIGVTNPSSPLHVAGKAVIETSYFGDGIELNCFSSGNRYAGIDFHGDDTYTDYGLRIIRGNTGPDAPSSIEHCGLGALRLFTEQAAPIQFSTSSILRMTISPAGEINVNSNKITNVAKPVNVLDAANKAYVDAIKEIIYDELLEAGLNGIVKDNDGNIYKTIKIGQQVWMAENLAYLPLVSHPASGSTTKPIYYVYGYTDSDVSAAKNSANYTTFGVLYNWLAALTACPSGWHLPSDAEWTTLSTFLGGESVAGGKMKETGTIHWGSPNDGATNESGFSGLPGGARYRDGTFGEVGYLGYWWSSSEYSTTIVWNRTLDYLATSVYRWYYFSKDYGLSVRCVRDNN